MKAKLPFEMGGRIKSELLAVLPSVLLRVL